MQFGIKPRDHFESKCGRTMKNLQSSYNEAANEIIEQAEQEEKKKF